MPSPIKTPDQRLRVFVSSTLGELAPERAAVREAIEHLRLIPVMFEMGARPHPPRELYRSYLEQSHVFVGIYWQRYGWVAPGEEISGLEDEYRLAGDRPRLLYLKRPAPEMEDRLAGLIDDFQADDLASYKQFSDADELAALVEDDLAVLLSERFEATVNTSASSIQPSALPVPLTELFGREADVASVAEALRSGRRLVTLTGPGGSGKTRLAVEVARTRSAEHDRVHFVALENVTDRDQALHLIASGLGTRVESGTAVDAVVAQLADRPTLVVLDNTERIDELGSALVEVLERAPGPQLLVTSRRALRVRGEWEHVVTPLAVPDGEASAGELRANPAVELFVDRSRAVSAGFEPTDVEIRAIAEVARRLDGLPLAIELAAAASRLLRPEALLDRLGSSLDLVPVAATDLPERQRTIRATIDWSYGLLTDAERTLLARLGVFTGSWTIEAAEAVCAGDGVDLLEAMAGLLDKSLVVSDATRAEPRFRLLESVRAYALERLAEHDDPDATRTRHLRWFRQLGERAQPHLCGPGQREWVARMDAERPNLGAAVDTAMSQGQPDEVVELAWDVIVLYFVRDAVHEPDGWLRRVAESEPTLDEVTDAKLRSLLALTRIHHGDYTDVHQRLLQPLDVFRAHGMDFEAAVVLHQVGFVRFARDGDPPSAIEALEESSRLFERVDHDWGISLAEAMLGSVYAATGALDAAERCQRRSLEHARLIESDQQIAQADGQLALVRLLQERYDDALALVVDSAEHLRREHLRTDTTNALDVLAVVAHERGEVRAAAIAAGVAAAERARLGIAPWPTIVPFIDRISRWIRRSLGSEEFERITAESEGRDPLATLDATLDAFAS